jgi:hypothetical protein
MSVFQTTQERQKSIHATWIFAAKVLFALALVLAATFALVRTEVVAGGPISTADLLVMPE